jgi:hypothetical protein
MSRHKSVSGDKTQRLWNGLNCARQRSSLAGEAPDFDIKAEDGQSRAHIFAAANFPSSAPNSITPTSESVRFDADIHLQLEPPAHIKMLSASGKEQTDCVQFPVPLSKSEKMGQSARAQGTGNQVPFTGLAYSAPFRVLSDEGLNVFRQVIAENEQYAGSIPALVPKCIRGLGYRSDFVRELNYCKPLLEHLSHCAGISLGPHDMGMNLSQINFGEIGGGVVNQWHMDSVPYVIVILLSDATDMEGGELLVARLGDPRKAIEMIRAETIDPALIDKVNYPGAGYAIFMQGAEIAHAVTPVLRAKEPRLTCVNSYQSLNPFGKDHTVYSTFTTMDGDAHVYEFGRHVAWRVQGQLDYLMNEVQNGQKGHEEVKAILENSAAELQRAADLVSGRIQDERPYDVDGAGAAEADAAIEAHGSRTSGAARRTRP